MQLLGLDLLTGGRSGTAFIADVGNSYRTPLGPSGTRLPKLVVIYTGHVGQSTSGHDSRANQKPRRLRQHRQHRCTYLA
jgi:hypothetical protein